jgi:hypothetical protein
MVRIPVIGASVVAGAVGVALLAGPLAVAQAAGYQDGYYNGGFCYQQSEGEPNIYRLRVSEIKYDPNGEFARFSFLPQKWDNSSNQYRDDASAYESVGVAKYLLQEGGTNGTGYTNPNDFCRTTTEHETHLGGDVYSYGAWTSKR